MDGSNTAGSFKVDDPASFMPPKIEITGIEPKQAPPPRPHKLKPRDMNVLTPSGFWRLSRRSTTLPHYFSFFIFSFLLRLLIYCSAFLSPPSSLSSPSSLWPTTTLPKTSTHSCSFYNLLRICSPSLKMAPLCSYSSVKSASACIVLLFLLLGDWKYWTGFEVNCWSFSV